MSNKDIEKDILERLKENKLLKEVGEVVEDYKELIELFPAKEQYRKEVVEYLYFNYQYTDPLDWVDWMEEGINLAKEARESVQEGGVTFFYLYEYKFIIELIRYDPSYSEDFEFDYLMELLDEAIKADPFNSEAYMERGNLYQADDDFDRADIEFKKAASIKENDSVLFEIANNSEVTGNTDDAIKSYARLYETTESDAVKGIALEGLIRQYKQLDNKEKVDYYEDLLDNLA